MIGMNKFLKVHNYSKNVKKNVASFILRGKDDISSEDLHNVKNIREEKLSRK